MTKALRITSSRGAPMMVRQLRENAQLTQRQLAEKAGLDQGQLCRIEAAEDMRVSTMLSLAEELGYEVVLRPRNDVDLGGLIEEAISGFHLACFDNVDTDALPRDEDTARFAIRRLEHLGGRKGFMLACRLRRALMALTMDR